MNKKSKSGFTLIEVIVAIVLFAIAMAAALPFLDRVYLMSYEPGAQLNDHLSLHSAMEELVLWHTNGLEQLRAHVGAAGGFYQGEYRVVDNRYIAFPGNVESDVVVSNILLKITLENALGEKMTRLFTVPL